MALTPAELESLHQCHGFKKLQDTLQKRLVAKERQLTRMDASSPTFALDYTKVRASVDELCAVLSACRLGSDPE